MPDTSIVHFESLEKRRLLSGLTLITHGQGGDAGGDVARAANLVAQRAGGAVQYVMTVTSDNGVPKVTSFTHDSSTPSSTTNGEVIVRLDWSDVKISSTSLIADAVADFMVGRNLKGGPLVEQELALGGPSRGASIMSSLAERFGTHGIWVDQVTYLDPVPIPLLDESMMVTENVIFADNYWRSDGNPFNTDFDGQAVDGAH